MHPQCGVRRGLASRSKGRRQDRLMPDRDPPQMGLFAHGSLTGGGLRGVARRTAARMRRRRHRFKVYPDPVAHMSVRRPFPVSVHSPGEPPAEVSAVAGWFEGVEDGRERFRWVLRDSIDELLDGQRTGRWGYQQLSKTEKTHLGTVIEVNLTKEFELPDGVDLDWRVADQDLDCKFSKDMGSWSIPMEMYLCPDHEEKSGNRDHQALLVWVCDDCSQWAAGMLVITDARLRWTRRKSGEWVRAYNRDFKRTLTPEAQREIYWLWGGLQQDLPENTILHMPPVSRARVFADAVSGQARVNALFVEIQRKLVRRAIVLTVAQQDDAPKRVRDARIKLRDQGVIILGHQDSHPAIAGHLGVEVPEKGEWISLRLAPVEAQDRRPKVLIDEAWWAIAEPDELSPRAPAVPKALGPQPFREGSPEANGPSEA